MKILALGMGRTGTKSLQKIGFHVYDFPDRVVLGHVSRWVEALRWKWYGEGPVFGREQLDELTGDFDVVMDMPCCLFVDELLAAYPDAKVILTTRSVESWHRSMLNTIFQVFSWPSWRVLQYTDRFAANLLYHHRTLWGSHDGDKTRQCTQVFIDHNNYVRKVVPPERLLEFQVKDGWEPLCQFLDISVPDAPFPSANDSAGFIQAFKRLWRRSVKQSIRNITTSLLIVAVGFYGVRHMLG
ncbi:hypothetical protein FE257_011835 [Aspergillus nanangensis]|uniref:NAD dependent epimerase/dehydratase n=1 Tax=Aspergillus nanangensis TaxID=2582783 RepID=A0AAD4CX41_ASPNN|nr:hypothetical protein FE257_011835 [Aspergillus nanangensis]